MSTVLKGRIKGNRPYFYCKIDTDGILLLKSRKPGERIIVDTGFTGTVALPQETLTMMELDFGGEGEFMLANGDIVNLPIYWGHVRIGSNSFETWFIPGDFLVGMELFEVAAKRLTLDLSNRSVYLES